MDDIYLIYRIVLLAISVFGMAISMRIEGIPLSLFCFLMNAAAFAYNFYDLIKGLIGG